MSTLVLKITASLKVDEKAYEGSDPLEVEKENLEREGLANYLNTLEEIGADMKYKVEVCK